MLYADSTSFPSSQEETGLRTYCHIGTGNYNPRTAGVYTDFGLFTCDPALGQDVADLFKYLTGYHRQKAYRKLLVAPGTMRREFVRLIDRWVAAFKDCLLSIVALVQPWMRASEDCLSSLCFG